MIFDLLWESYVALKSYEARQRFLLSITAKKNFFPRSGKS